VTSDDGGPLRLARGVELPLALLTIRAVTGGGPGGQSVNKTASTCELRVRVADLPLLPDVRLRLMALAAHRLVGPPEDADVLISNSETRSFRANRAAALEQLAELVRDALVRPKVRRPTRRSRGSIRRRLDDKRHVADKKRERRDE
jgi:ribosome-associated protein